MGGVLHTGHVPAEDSHHSIVFCLHAGEKVGFLPVALAALPHGWSRSCAGTILQSLKLSCCVNVVCFCWMNVTLFAHHNTLMDRFEVLCQSTCMYFNLHSGPQWMKLILSRTSCLQARSLWDWWLCWWHVCPVALREFTLKKSLRRLNRACGSVIYSWVSEASVCVVGWDDLRCVNIRVWNSCSVWQKNLNWHQCRSQICCWNKQPGHSWVKLKSYFLL